MLGDFDQSAQLARKGYTKKCEKTSMSRRWIDFVSRVLKISEKISGEARKRLEDSEEKRFFLVYF